MKLSNYIYETLAKLDINNKSYSAGFLGLNIPLYKYLFIKIGEIKIKKTESCGFAITIDYRGLQKYLKLDCIYDVVKFLENYKLTGE